VLVDDQPGRDGRVGVVDVVHRVDDVAVGGGLVDEAGAGGVDQQAAGEGAFGEAEVRLAGERDRRAPPGVVHQAEGGADTVPGPDAVAGVLLRADRPVRADGLALVGRAHRRVVLEAARADDHAAAGADQGAVPIGAGRVYLDRVIVGSWTCSSAPAGE
jgi:hypothetical protein